MKIFVDLGAYTGDSIQIASRSIVGIKRYYGFEPYRPHFEKLQSRFGGISNIRLFNFAADREDRNNIKLYLRLDKDNGHSLMKEKTNCSKREFSLVRTVDFSRFVENNFRKEDEIILKLNIEGKEYDVLEKMIGDGTIKYINKIYCAWHCHKVNMPRMRHDNLIRTLRGLGFDVNGNDGNDNFVMVFNPIPLRSDVFP